MLASRLLEDHWTPFVHMTYPFSYFPFFHATYVFCSLPLPYLCLRFLPLWFPIGSGRVPNLLLGPFGSLFLRRFHAPTLQRAGLCLLIYGKAT